MRYNWKRDCAFTLLPLNPYSLYYDGALRRGSTVRFQHKVTGSTRTKPAAALLALINQRLLKSMILTHPTKMSAAKCQVFTIYTEPTQGDLSFRTKFQQKDCGRHVALF